MGCLIGQISRTDTALGGVLKISDFIWDGIVECSSKPLIGAIKRLGQMSEGLMNRTDSAWQGGSMSLICVVSKEPFIKVTPDMVWLTSDIDSEGQFIVGTNTQWNIE